MLGVSTHDPYSFDPVRIWQAWLFFLTSLN